MTSASGWAVVVDGRLRVETVAAQRLDATIKWLQSEGVVVTKNNSDYLIEESFKLLRVPKRAEARPVTVTAPVRGVP